MKPYRPAVFAAATVILCTIATAASASESPIREKALTEAQKSIDRCWAESLKDRSSRSIAFNRRGHARTVGCLKKTALEEMARIFEENKGLSGQQSDQKIEALLEATANLYWPIYNQNDSCGTVCGMANDYSHMSEQAEILEILIRSVIQLRRSYEWLKFPPRSGNKR